MIKKLKVEDIRSDNIAGVTDHFISNVALALKINEIIDCLDVVNQNISSLRRAMWRREKESND